MFNLSRLRIVASLLVAAFILICPPGCWKDYSYEGGPAPDSTGTGNVVESPTGDQAAPTCSACLSQSPDLLQSWSFKVGSALFCGHITSAVINYNRTAFTFFGPSTCSPDSGLIMTIYLENQKLDHDLTNIVTEKIVFQYYDNITPSFYLQSKPIRGFSFTVDQYWHQTGQAVGHFSGAVYDSTDKQVTVSDGRYFLKFR